MSNSLTDKVKIDDFLKGISSDDIASAIESVAPLMTGERVNDTVWLCALCYLLGKRGLSE